MRGFWGAGQVICLIQLTLDNGPGPRRKAQTPYSNPNALKLL